MSDQSSQVDGAPETDDDEGGARNGVAWGRYAVLLAVVALFAWTATAREIASWMAESRVAGIVATETATADEHAVTIGLGMVRTLAQYSGVPAMLAADPRFVDALVASEGLPNPTRELRQMAARSRPELISAGRALAAAGRDASADALLLVNAAGDCVAASNAEVADSGVGSRFGATPAFGEALAGRRGRDLVIDKATGSPSLLLSAPIVANGRVIGAILARIDRPRFAHWVDRANGYIADASGVIFLARQPALEWRALRDSPVLAMPVAEREARYQRRQFTALEVSDAGDQRHRGLVRIDGADTPHVIARADKVAGGYSVHVLGRLDAVAEVRRDAAWMFVVLVLAGAAAIAAVTLGCACRARVLAHRSTVSQANVALRDLRNRLRRQARTDALTGCATRGYFFEVLDGELARARRYHHPVSLVAVHLDHFERINDGYGHAAGDLGLKHFSALAMRRLRGADVIGRIGGAEFLILLPETAENGANVFAERLRQAIEQEPPRMDDKIIALTVSAGVAELISEGETADVLVGVADEALQRAKDAGGNCVESRRRTGAPTVIDLAA